MKARDQKEIKGIYHNEINGNVYFVNKVDLDRVRVSTVITRKIDMGGWGMVKVLKDDAPIPLDVFKEFKFVGNYRREDLQ